MIKIHNKSLKLEEGQVFEGTCGSLFKIVHKCSENDYLIRTLGFIETKLFKFQQKAKARILNYFNTQS